VNPLIRILWEQAVLPFQLVKEGIDLVHSLAFVQPLFNPCPGVVTIYDLSFLLFPEGFNPWKRLYLRFMAPYSARSSQRVIALSQSTKSDLTRLLGIPQEKIEVIPCGVDPRFRPLNGTLISQFRQRRGLPERMILFVGTIEQRKNVRLLLEAYAQIKKDIPHALVLAGAKGWGAEGVFAQAERLGLTDLIFAGYVEQEELPLWYNAADLLAYLSLYEGFGLPPLEAMASGTPVVTSNISSLPEVVGDAGVLVDPQDAEVIARAMLKVLRDRGLQEEMRKRGLERAKRFTWQGAAEETVRVYEEAMRGEDV
jgi:glycosyltransferase involved in cell wall biosynthesis